MLTKLGLRLRIFLFFCLLGLGALVVLAGALWIGYQRAGNPDLLTPLLFAGLLSGFLILGLVAAIWLLFDEHVAKPIELLAAAQAIDFHKPLKTSPLLGGLHARLRERVPFYAEDRYFAPDIAAAKEMVSGTDFHALVGNLLPSIRG